MRKIYKKQTAIPVVNLYPSPPRFFLFEIKNPRMVKINIENALYECTLGSDFNESNIRHHYSEHLKNLRKFKKRLDPRLYNGAILLGLDSPVVKSHGSTDFIGFSNSLNMCEKIVSGKLIDKIKENLD